MKPQVNFSATKAVLDKNSVGSILEHTELIGELFQDPVPAVNEHLKGIYHDGELDPAATIRKFRIVREDETFSQLEALAGKRKDRKKQ